MKPRTLLMSSLLAVAAGLGAGASFAIPPSPNPCADACWRAYNRCMNAGPEFADICAMQREECLMWCAPV